MLRNPNSPKFFQDGDAQQVGWDEFYFSIMCISCPRYSGYPQLLWVTFFWGWRLHLRKDGRDPTHVEADYICVTAHDDLRDAPLDGQLWLLDTRLLDLALRLMNLRGNGPRSGVQNWGTSTADV